MPRNLARKARNLRKDAERTAKVLLTQATIRNDWFNSHTPSRLLEKVEPIAGLAEKRKALVRMRHGLGGSVGRISTKRVDATPLSRADVLTVARHFRKKNPALSREDSYRKALDLIRFEGFEPGQKKSSRKK